MTLPLLDVIVLPALIIVLLAPLAARLKPAEPATFPPRVMFSVALSVKLTTPPTLLTVLAFATSVKPATPPLLMINGAPLAVPFDDMFPPFELRVIEGLVIAREFEVAAC